MSHRVTTSSHSALVGLAHLGLERLQALLGGETKSDDIRLLARNHLDGAEGGLSELSVTCKDDTDTHLLSFHTY